MDNVSFGYREQQVLSDISFNVEYGEVLSVLGPNGVGKSTLFRNILGLLQPQRGKIIIDGKAIDKMNPKQLARKMAYIPQSNNPVFNYKVFDMVLMGTTAQTGSISMPGQVQIKLVDAALEKLGIAQIKDKGYAYISGGERQLVLFARAIVQQAKILVMDEPSSSLDYGNRIRIMKTVRDLAKEGYAIIQSTHDPEQAFMYSDKILAIHNGKVLAYGTPKDIINDDLISKLYGVEVEVCSLRNDSVRVCVPIEI